MEQPQKAPKKDNTTDNAVAYAGVGLVFFIVGVASLANSSMSSMAIPFLALGVAFFGIASGGSFKQLKKNDKPPQKPKKQPTDKTK